MKQLFSVALAFVLVSACGLKKKHTTDEALAHNDKLIDLLDPYFSVADEFGYVLLDDSVNPKESYNKVLSTIASIKSKYEAEPSFDDEDILKNAGINYMDALKRIYETEYKNMIDIKTNPDYNNIESEKYTDLLDEYQVAYDKAEEKLKKASEEFDAKQSNFAAKYNFTIGD